MKIVQTLIFCSILGLARNESFSSIDKPAPTNLQDAVTINKNSGDIEDFIFEGEIYNYTNYGSTRKKRSASSTISCSGSATRLKVMTFNIENYYGSPRDMAVRDSEIVKV